MSRFVKTIADRRVSLREFRFWIVALLAVFVAAGAAPKRLAAAQTADQRGGGKSSKLESALRERVQQFYALLQTGQTAKAAEYVMKAGRDRFRAQPSGPFLAFKIVSADVDPDGKHASAVVEMSVMSAQMGGVMPFQRNLHWQIEDGKWRLEMPAAVVGSDNVLEMGKGLNKPSKSEDLQFKGHSYGLGVMKPGERKEVRFPFTNTSDHVVKITDIATGCDCLKVKSHKMEYKPGESGEIVIDFDSTGYEFEYDQTVVVKTDPGDISSHLRIHGTVVSQAIFDMQKAHSQSTPPSDPPPAPVRQK